MLFVGRQSVEEAVSINNSRSKLTVAHKLPELLAPWLVLRQKMHVQGHVLFQRRETVRLRKSGGISSHWDFLSRLKSDGALLQSLAQLLRSLH